VVTLTELARGLEIVRTISTPNLIKGSTMMMINVPTTLAFGFWEGFFWIWYFFGFGGKDSEHAPGKEGGDEKVIVHSSLSLSSLSHTQSVKGGRG